MNILLIKKICLHRFILDACYTGIYFKTARRYTLRLKRERSLCRKFFRGVYIKAMKWKNINAK